MKKALRVLALIIVLAAVGYWFAAGANRGWTKNKIQIKTMDEVTGIESTTDQKKYVPGVDFLAEAFGAAFVLASVSFFFRNKRPITNNNPQI